MPCDTRIPRGMTAAEREQQIAESVQQLESQLLSGGIQVALSPEGAVAFVGWEQGRNGVSDVCAFHRLQAAGSMALTQALEMAEAQSGRRLNPQSVAAGIHSHDGGRTWSGGH